MMMPDVMPSAGANDDGHRRGRGVGPGEARADPVHELIRPGRAADEQVVRRAGGAGQEFRDRAGRDHGGRAGVSQRRVPGDRAHRAGVVGHAHQIRGRAGDVRSRGVETAVVARPEGVVESRRHRRDRGVGRAGNGETQRGRARREHQVERAVAAAASAVGVVRPGDDPAVGDVEHRRRHAAANRPHSGAALDRRDARVGWRKVGIDPVNLAVGAGGHDLPAVEQRRLDLRRAAPERKAVGNGT